MDFFSAMEISASGLTAERERVNVASSNVANAHTTRSANGGPYKRRDVVLSSQPQSPLLPGGLAGKREQIFSVAVDKITEDTRPPRLEYDPGHPDANAQGYVAYPNVNVVEEMVDMITASRAYQAGMTALDAAVSLSEKSLSIGGK